MHTPQLQWRRLSASFFAGAMLIATALAQEAQTTQSQKLDDKDKLLVLPAYSVNVDDERGYIGTNSLSATSAAIPTIDLPFTMTVLTRQVLEDTGAFQLMNLSTFVSGMQNFDRPYDDSESQTLRGFQALVVTDNHQTLGETTHDLSIVERVEVLKGSSAILFAQGGSPGGTINMITKSPLEKQAGYLRVQAGQFNANRVELDYNGAPLVNKKLLYRIVFAHHDADGFSETEFTKRTIFFPSLTYKFSDDTKLTLKYEHVKSTSTSPTGQGMGPHGEDQLAQGIVYFDFSLPRERSFDDPDNDRYRKKEDQYWATLESKLTDTLGMRTGFHWADTYDARLGTRPIFNPVSGPANPPNTPIIAADGTVQRVIFEPQWHRNNLLVFFDTSSVFSVLKTNHTFMVGGKYTSTQGSTKQPPGIQYIPTNAYAPPPAGGPNPGFNTPWLKSDTNGWWSSVYAMDVIKLWKDRITLNAGMTQNWVDNLNYQTATDQYKHQVSKQRVKQYGALIQPIKNVYLYASSNENYSPSSSILGILQPNGTYIAGGIAPSKFNVSKEIGLKLRLFQDRLSFNFASYNTQLTNRSRGILNTNFAELLPNGSSKGFEGDMMYQVNKNLSVIGTFAKINGRDKDGIRFTDIPTKTASAWVRYDFRQGTFKGLGLSGGMTYCDSMENVDRGVRFSYAGRTLFAAGVYYTYKDVRFQVNASNVFDKDYYAGGSPPQISYRGERRNVQGSVTYSF